MKRRLMALLLALLLMAGSAAAQSTSQEREMLYLSAVRELESYFDMNLEDVGELQIILAAFEGMGNYRQSYFMCYYIRTLISITEGNFDFDYRFDLEMMTDNERFCAYLEELRQNDSSIGTVAELKSYGEGRRLESEGDRDGAAEAYKACLGFYDAAVRRERLLRSVSEETYQEASGLMRKKDLAGAYMLFAQIPDYGDSADKMRYIEELLGYVPASASDNPGSVTGLKVTKSGPDSITISWNAAAHASSYRVEYRKSAGGNGKQYLPFSTSATITGLEPGTSYTISVTAIAGQLEMDAVSVTGKTASVTAPVSGLKAAETASDSVTLNWSRVNGAAKYKVRWKTKGAKSWTDWKTVMSNSYTVAGLSAGTVYDFEVVAVSSDEILSSVTYLRDVRTSDPALAAVTGLKAIDVKNTSITLSWSKVTGAACYKVCWKKHSTGGWSKWKAVYGTEYSVNDLVTDTAYDFMVVAVSFAGVVSPEKILSDVKTENLSQDPVSALKATDRKATTLILSWNKAAGAAAYKVCWKQQGARAWSEWKQTSAAQYSVTGLEPDTVYDFKVVAVSASGVVSTGKTLSGIRTQALVPDMVTGFKAKAIATSSVTLSWNKSANASRYRVFRKRNSDTDWSEYGTTDSTGLMVKNLYSNAVYDFQVVAEGNGKSASPAVLNNIRTSVDIFQDGKLKDTSIKTALSVCFRDPQTGKVQKVKKPNAGTMTTDMRNKNYDYGVDYSFTLPSLKASREFKLRVDLAAPDGYQVTVYDVPNSYNNIGYAITWRWNIVGEGFFSQVLSHYGNIPSGTYILTLYWDDMLVDTSPFTISP